MARYSVEGTFLPFQKSGGFSGFSVVFRIEGTKKPPEDSLPYLSS